MIAVYIAGKMSAPNPIQFLRNLNAMQEWTAKIRDLGYAPFPVADDYADIMRTKTVGLYEIQEASLTWLRRADVMFVCPGYAGSTGTAKEISEANNLGIMITYTIGQLEQFKIQFREGVQK